MYGVRLAWADLPSDVRGRAQVLQWLFWQVGGLGPMAGQNGHFVVYAPEKVPYAIERYVKETNRLYGVLDERLDTLDRMGVKLVRFTLTMAGKVPFAVEPFRVCHSIPDAVGFREIPGEPRGFARLASRFLATGGGRRASSMRTASSPSATPSATSAATLARVAPAVERPDEAMASAASTTPAPSASCSGRSSRSRPPA